MRTIQPGILALAATLALLAACDGAASVEDRACSDSEACVSPDSRAIAEVRAAPPDTRIAIPVTGTVTYVLPEGVKHHGFFLQAEAEGPALFLDRDWVEAVHRDDRGRLLITVPEVAPGDVVRLEVASVGDNFGMTHVRDVVPKGEAAWVVEDHLDPAGLAVDSSGADDLRTDFERWESRLVTVTGTLALPIRTAGDGFSQWPLATEGMPEPPHGLLLRVADAILSKPGPAALAQGCEVTARVPIWGYRDPDSGLDYAQATAYRVEDVLSVACP